MTRVADPGLRAPPFTFPRHALRLASHRAGRSRYVFLGHPDLSQVQAPWRYLERMGEAYFAETDDFRLTLLARSPRPYLTEVRLLVEPLRRPA